MNVRIVGLLCLEGNTRDVIHMNYAVVMARSCCRHFTHHHPGYWNYLILLVHEEIQLHNNMGEIREVVLSIVPPQRRLDSRTHNIPSRVEVAAFIPDVSYDNDNVHIRILYN